MSRQTVTKVYVSYGSSILENFMDRATGGAGVTSLRDYLRNDVKAWATKEWGDTAKIKWDRHCGCGMCPCSPGWRVTVNTDSRPFYGDPIEVWAKADDNGVVTVGK